MSRRTPHPIVAQLRADREDRGWSQAALARRIGVGTSTVQTWEDGSRQPVLRHLLAYARALGRRVTLTPIEEATDAQ
jgi:transcriptional regulator with XRE-family HTH domain